MNEDLRKKIVYATLPLALLWAALSWSGRKSAPVEPQPVDTYRPDTTKTAVTQKPPAANLEYRRDAAWGRDPFNSARVSSGPSTASPGPSENLAWVLAGIVFGNQKPMALINNQMVTVGDRIGDATVVAIDKESVTLERQGRRFKLRVSKG